MTTSSLSPVAAVVLGLLEVHGPSTPYEMEQEVEISVGHFWAFPRSQLYGEPARLLTAGLVSEVREETGRRRRTFSITDAGRTALQAWLAVPVSEGSELRDLGLLRLFFGTAAASPSDILENARLQASVHEAQLEAYLAMQGEGDPFMQRTLQLGIAVETAMAAFWTSLSEDLSRDRSRRPQHG